MEEEKSKILLIVESPAKAKTISKYLGSDFIVRATMGHIFDLSFTGPLKMGINIDNGFKPNYTVIPDKKDKLKAIINSAKIASAIYIASDPDREGEAIAWHLYEVLKSLQKPIKRVLFTEITKSAIKKAIMNPGELDKDLFNAQQCRRVLDRIVGFSVSPILIKRYGPHLSAGRVQSVAARLVIDREKEIEKFQPEEYWNISATLSKLNDEENKFVAKYNQIINNEQDAKRIKNELDNDSFEVFKVNETEKNKNPYPPLITSTLAAVAAGKFNFSTAKTMKAAQKLYESGIITYMRTDSVRSSPESIQACRQWLQENNLDFPTNPNVYSAKQTAQDGHEAIRPTHVDSIPKDLYLQEDEEKVYQLIWERFIASQMNPARYDNVNVVIKSSSGHLLKINGRTLKDKGWLQITQDDNGSDNDLKLPILNENEQLILIVPKIKTEQKFTKPISRFSEKTLIIELEKLGIGRPSTFASIMSKITARNFVNKKKNAFVPTELGTKVIDDLTQHFTFMNVNYTSKLEAELDKIAEGKLKYLDMLTSFYEPFKNEVRRGYLADTTDYGINCNICGSRTVLKHGKYGYYLACIDYPQKCRGTYSCSIIDNKPVIKENRLEVIEGIFCPICNAVMVKRDGLFGPFYSCSNFYINKCRGSRKIPYGKNCPNCSKDLYATHWKGKNVLFCMGYSEGCTYSEDLPEDFINDPNNLCAGTKIPHELKKIIKQKREKKHDRTSG